MAEAEACATQLLDTTGSEKAPVAQRGLRVKRWKRVIWRPGMFEPTSCQRGLCCVSVRTKQRHCFAICASERQHESSQKKDGRCTRERGTFSRSGSKLSATVPGPLPVPQGVGFWRGRRLCAWNPRLQTRIHLLLESDHLKLCTFQSRGHLLIRKLLSNEPAACSDFRKLRRGARWFVMQHCIVRRSVSQL